MELGGVDRGVVVLLGIRVQAGLGNGIKVKDSEFLSKIRL